MELNASFWMIIVGVLLIVAVLLDGYRRMRSAQNDNLRIKVKKESVEGDDDFNPELPIGQARVVGSASAEKPLEELDPLFDEIPDRSATDSSTGGYAQPSISGKPAMPISSRKPATPTYDKAFEKKYLDDAILQDSPLLHEPELPKRQPITASRDDELSAEEVAYVRNQKPDSAASDSAPSKAKSEGGAKTSGKGGEVAGPQEIVVLHVMAGSEEGFGGRDLLQVLLACDVRFGSMNIFHRYEKEGGEGQPQFSVVNSVNPGTFDLDDIENFSTPGISFFMQLPGPSDSMVAFDCMVETARALVKNLGGSMQDETHSAATNQTLQHYRQRIRDFTRKQMTLV